ncbi:hypothetical protein ACLOJK_024754 [Asimina triloba]
MPSIIVSFLLLFLFFVFFFKLFQWRRYKLPPGPTPWPVVGNLLDIKPVRFRCFAEWASAYGPIVSVWFGSTLNVVVSSSEMAKQVLKEKDQVLADRPRNKTVQYFSRNGQDLIWADYGPHYVKVRKVCMLELFTPKRLESLRPIREDEVMAMVEAIFRDCTNPGGWLGLRCLFFHGTHNDKNAINEFDRGLHSTVCTPNDSGAIGQEIKAFNPATGLIENSGKSITIRDYLAPVSFNNITRLALGKRLMDWEGRMDEQGKELKSIVSEGVKIGGSLPFTEFIPWLGWFSRSNDDAIVKRAARRDRLTKAIMDEHTKARSLHGAKQHFVDVLLTLQDEYNLSTDTIIGLLWEIAFGNEKHRAYNPPLSAKVSNSFPPAQLRVGTVHQLTETPLWLCLKFLQDMITAGMDTTVIAVEWAMAELIRNPRVMKKAQEELDAVIGTHRVMVELDFPNLPYLQYVAKESLRLHPSTPLMLPHKANTHVKIGGYDIPKGSIVHVNAWAIARDPTVWKDPLEFRPERFIEEEIDMKGHDFRLLPFGAGRRVCPGTQLGINLVQSMLGHLLHHFNWALADGIRPEDMDMSENPGQVTFMKTPVRAIPTPRLPAHLHKRT